MATLKQQYRSEEFRDEMLVFREKMCSTEYTMEEKDQAWTWLWWVWFRTIATPELERSFDSLQHEWGRRAAYETLRGIFKK